MSDILESKPRVIEEKDLKVYKPKSEETKVYEPNGLEVVSYNEEIFKLRPGEVLLIDGYGARKSFASDVTKDYVEKMP
jgi:hypothetical protein